MSKRYFSIILFIFLISLSIPLFSSNHKFDPLNDYYYTERIDLGLTDISQEVYYITLEVTSQERILFERSFLTEEASSIPFKFESFYPSSLVISYSYFSFSQQLIEKKEYPLVLKKINKEINYYFCNDITCSQELFDIFEENKDFYLSSSLKDSFFNVKVTSQDYLKEYNNSSFPLKLNLKEGIYSLEISTVIENSIFEERLDIIVVSKEEISSQENNSLENNGMGSSLTPTSSQTFLEKIKSNSIKDNLRSYWYILLIIVIILFIILKKRKKETPMERNTLQRKEQQISRREARKIHIFILLFSLIIFSQITFSSTLANKEYEFSYFTDDYNSLVKNFPQENEISLYLTDLKKANSYFFPLISHANENLTYFQSLSLQEGFLDYTPIYSLFAIDINKSTGSYAPFLPKEPYSAYCKPVLDYFKRYPVTTKADLINRNKSYLENGIGFSKNCIDELITKKWLQEKVVLAEIKFTPHNYNNQSKIIQTEIFFKKSILSNEFNLPVNIIKTDSAVVYAYPDPINYNSLKLEIEENGWILSNKVAYPISFSDMDEIYRLSLSQGEHGSFTYTLNNYNENFVDFKINFLDQEKNLSFSSFLSSNYFSVKEGDENKNIITNLLFRNGNIVLNNYEIYNVMENRKRKLSISSSSESIKNIYSRKEYALFHTPNFKDNSFFISLSSGKSLNPIVKDDLYLFYNFDNNLFGKMDIYLIEAISNSYYFVESTANYKLRTNFFLLENEHLKITEVYSSKQSTSFHILFKDENLPIIITNDRKNIISTTYPYFYIYKDYFIVVSSGVLRVYKNNTGYTNKKVNTYSDYDNKLNYLTGKDAQIDNNLTKISPLKLKLFNSYIYDVSNAQDFSLIEQKLFWANTFVKADLRETNWFLKKKFCDVNKIDQDFNIFEKHLKRMNFTILKYPGYSEFPFSNVTLESKDYIIKRNSFTKDNYSLLCDYTKDLNLNNYTNIILNSAFYLEDQNNFIEQLSFFKTPIGQIYAGQEKYPSKYLSEYFTSSKEGIIFIDSNNNIAGASFLDFRKDYSSTIDFFANYLVFDRLSFFNPNDLVFSKDKTENENIQKYIKENYIDPKEKLFLKFKLPKRYTRLTDNYISKNFIMTNPIRKYQNRCTALSLDVTNNYHYNMVRHFSVYPRESDFVRDDAWFLATINQVVWDYRRDPPINPNRFFEGMILGIYIGKTTYTYPNNYHIPSRAGKKFTGLLYTHTAPYVDIYKNESGLMLNASFYVSAEEAVDYYTTSGRQLRQIVMPLNYYDNKIKDKYGKTELDYVKEYLTSFN